MRGGQRLSLSIDVRFQDEEPGQASLEFRKGDTRISASSLETTDEWQTVELSAIPWESDEPLVVAIHGFRGGKTVGGVILDRARL